MPARSAAARLFDIMEAIAHIRSVLSGTSMEAFETDWQKRWLVERGVEIISEASRHIDAAAKARHPEIPWSKVAGIGNVLRHEYTRVAPAVLWKLAQDDLHALEVVCRGELDHRPDGSPPVASKE